MANVLDNEKKQQILALGRLGWTSGASKKRREFAGLLEVVPSDGSHGRARVVFDDLAGVLADALEIRAPAPFDRRSFRDLRLNHALVRSFMFS